MSFYRSGWPPYVPVAERRRKALLALKKRRQQGESVSPVLVEGRTIARTFWGKAWCENLERYSDYENRLPRGRTYVRNGSVVDLRIASGAIHALVSGSSLYEVSLRVAPVSKARWKSICAGCAGSVASLVDLLQGRLSETVMERICRRNDGLFPAPAEIKLSCSCPDWAEMCKHVAAVLYGIGARLDHQPELLFLLRGVDEKDLIARAGKSLPASARAPTSAKVLGGEDLSDIFGLDMAEAVSPSDEPKGKPRARQERSQAAARKKAPAKKKGASKKKAPAASKGKNNSRKGRG